MAIDKERETKKRMINYMVVLLAKSSYKDIKADIPSCNEKPDKIIWKGTGKGFEPDITAFKNGVRYIIEIETEDTLTDENAKEQWVLFSRFADKTKALFYVFVPAGCKREATQRIRTLGISGNTKIIELSTK